MPILTANVTTTAVRNVLGESTNNVGELCSSPNINEWSTNKPYSLIAPANAEMEGGIYPRVHGLWRLKSGGVIYKKPAGGESDPYRLGDFRSYNENHIAPVGVHIHGSNEIIQGFSRNMSFSFWRGAINPVDITEQTNPVKRTSGEGYGGIAIAPRNAGVGDEVSSDNVYTADNSGTQYTVQINSDLFDFYYVERRIEGTYHIVGGTAPYKIEDLSYRDYITVVPFGVSINESSVVWVDFSSELGPQLIVNTSYSNSSSSSRSFTIEITATLTNNNGTYNISTSSALTVPANTTQSASSNLSASSVTQGSNTVNGAIRIYYSGVLVGGPSNFSRTFNASAPS